MTMQEVIENELKCVQRDCCRLENECAKCDLVLPKEEIINAYNNALKLEKENAELKDKLNNLASVSEVRLANWQKYEEENAELKKKIENLQKYLDTRNCYRECAETWVKLTEAKELLKKLYDETRGYINDQGFNIEILAEAKQFLKESEK